jgi:tetratricopeptide (TPR) repeat protein
MQVRCQSCGKEYSIKDDFVRKADLRMKCRGCGEVIVVKKIEETPAAAPAAVPPPPLTPRAQASEAILPKAKTEGAGLHEFDLDSAPITIPPPKAAKGTLLGVAVPPPPDRVAPKAIDDPFGDLPAVKPEPGAEFDFSAAPTPAKPLPPIDLPAPKPDVDESEFESFSPSAKTPVLGQLTSPPAETPGPSDLHRPSTPTPRFDDLPSAAKPGRPSAAFAIEEPKPGVFKDFGDLPVPAQKAKAADDFGDLPVPAQKAKAADDFGDLPVPAHKARAAEGTGAEPTPSKPKATLPMFKPDVPPPGPGQESGDDLPRKKTPAVPSPGMEAAGAGDDIFDALGMPPPKPSETPKGPTDIQPARMHVSKENLDVERSQKFIGQLGGTSFGEIDLGEAPPQAPSDVKEKPAPEADLPERKRRPGDAAEALAAEAMVELDSAAATDAARARDKAKAAVAKAKGVPRGWKLAGGGKRTIALLAALVLVGAGVAVYQTGAYVSVAKLFRRHVMGEDVEAYFAMRDKAVAEVNARLVDDNYKDYVEGIRKLKAVYDGNREDVYLAAHLSTLISTMEIRFGEDKAMDAVSEGLLAQIPVENEFPLTALMATSSARILRKVGGAQAASSLQAEVQKHPRDAELLHLTALAFLSLRNGAAAETLYRQLATLENSSRRSVFGQIRAAYLGGKDAEADELLNAFIEKHPDFLEAQVLKARRNVTAGSLSQAESIIDKLLGEKKYDPYLEIPLKAIRGTIFLKKEQYQKAKVVFEEIINADPTDLGALLGLGAIDLYEGNAARALGRFNMVLAADPQSDEAKFGAVQCHIQLDQYKEARDLLTGLKATLGEDFRFFYYSALLEASLSRLDDAEALFKTAIEKNPMNLDSYLALADFYFDHNRGPEGMALLEVAKNKLPLTAKLLTGFARGRIERGEYAEAKSDLLEAVAKDPAYTHAHYFLGVALYALGSYDEALQQFDTVAAENPTYPGLVLHQGLIFEKKGEMDKALASYMKALEQKSDDEGVMLRAIALYLANDKIDDAQILVDKILKINPASAEAVYDMGRVEYGRKQFPEALHTFDKAIKLSPGVGLYYLWAGLTSERLTNYADALKYAERAVEKDPNLPEAYLLRGKLLVRLGMVKDGKADLLKVLELKPGLAEVWGPMGIIHEEERNFAEAITAYKKFLDVHPEDFEIHCRLGLLLLEKGDLGDARQHLADAAEVAKATSPSSKWRFTALYYLGVIAEREGNTAKAIEVYQAYIADAPMDAIDREEVLSRLGKLKP